MLTMPLLAVLFSPAFTLAAFEPAPARAPVMPRSPQGGGPSSWAAPPASRHQRPTPAVPGHSSPQPPSILFDIDPTADLSLDELDPAILAQGRLAGPLLLKDGQVLRGTVVADGLIMAPGASVFVGSGSTIISVGPDLLAGRFVPFTDQVLEAPASWALLSSESAPPSFADEDAFPMEAAHAPKPEDPGPPCPELLLVTGDSGAIGAPIVFLFRHNLTITTQFEAFCEDPPESMVPQPSTLEVIGTPSVEVRAGHGGGGTDLVITMVGDAILTIDGRICSSSAVGGATAVAIGNDGAACGCGGNATAYGGNGGPAGDVTITGRFIRWGPLAKIIARTGAVGGWAHAYGGTGGECNVCGQEGGRGGRARAFAGDAGKPSRIVVKATKSMQPGPHRALMLHSQIELPTWGGGAAAKGGEGGRGGSCDHDDCVETGGLAGGRGGNAGSAFALGGKGPAASTISLLKEGGPMAIRSTDGGDGGNAEVEGAPGGQGGVGAWCSCDQWVQAGQGGLGGVGSTVLAKGGQGGPAYLHQALLGSPNSGKGGSASGPCGLGGGGGPGGGCFGGLDIGCEVGGPGQPGPGGSRTLVGGKSGAAEEGAARGASGLPMHPTTDACGLGLGGIAGVWACYVDVWDCCEASSLPGCPDAACEALVCALHPDCCDLVWDWDCAHVYANWLCPRCSGEESP